MDVSPSQTFAEATEAPSVRGVLPPPTSVALRIARQLRSHLDGHRPSGDAFVVSVYGEWGIGKTYCLKSIRDLFAEDLGRDIGALVRDQTQTHQLTIPVFFDPWRYEHEEHLVVPLLKTIEYELRKVQETIEAKAAEARSATDVATEMGKNAIRTIGRAINIFGNVAVALAAGFKFKLAPLEGLTGLGVELSVKDALEAARKASEQSAQDRAGDSGSGYAERASSLGAVLAQRESLYFDTHTALRQLTEGDDLSLRLVVLIDDLDRCLPEKAVQVLESVKLFLNVPGFSFVLAVDDEVVERGIAHRYRDYLPIQGDARARAAPISGAEYLEKIVHLPVHLQRWTKEEAADFLRKEYPQYFAPPTAAAEPESGSADGAPKAKRAPRADTGSGQQDAERLVALVTGAVPLVPRKLIRLAEALAFQYEHFGQLGEVRHWSPLHAVRLIALQQLYSGLYRHLRQRESRYWRLFHVTRDDYGDPTYGGQSLHELEELLKARPQRPKSGEAAAPTPTGERTDTLREKLDLLALTEQASQLRGAPDPLLLFARPDGITGEQWGVPDSIAQNFTYESFLRLYVHGLSLPVAPPAVPSPDSSARPLTAVQDRERLLAALLDPDPIARRELFDSPGVTGTRLPDDVFDMLNQRIPRARAGDIAWLRDIANVTSPEQLLTLYRDHDVLDRVLDTELQGAKQ